MKASRWNQALLASSAFLLAVPSVVHAQACKINDSSPFQVNGAKQYVTMAANSPKESKCKSRLSLLLYKRLGDDCPGASRRLT